MKETFLKTVDGKNAYLKQRILGLCINEGDFSLADLSKEIGTSIPTTTKLVEELLNPGMFPYGQHEIGVQNPSLKNYFHFPL